MLQAPDVAIAEAAVGVVLTTIIFVVALRKTGGKGVPPRWTSATRRSPK